MSRGILTSETKDAAIKYLGRDLHPDELRLYPYLLFQIMNNCELNTSRIRPYEVDILNKLVEEKRISFEDGKINSPFKVTPEFYDAICAILKVGYASDMIGDTASRKIGVVSE